MRNGSRRGASCQRGSIGSLLFLLKQEGLAAAHFPVSGDNISSNLTWAVKPNFGSIIHVEFLDLRQWIATKNKVKYNRVWKVGCKTTHRHAWKDQSESQITEKKLLPMLLSSSAAHQGRDTCRTSSLVERANMLSSIQLQLLKATQEDLLRGLSMTARGRSAKLALGPAFTLQSVSVFCVCVCLPLQAGQRWSAPCDFSHWSSTASVNGSWSSSPEDSCCEFTSRACGDGGTGRIAACHNNLAATFVKEQRMESGAGGRLLCWIGVWTRQVSWTREPDKRNKSLF